MNGNFGTITAADLMTLAERFEIGDARGVFSDVAAAVDSWPQFARSAGVAAKTTAEIGRNLQSAG